MAPARHGYPDSERNEQYMALTFNGSTHALVVLDKSGSMAPLQADTIGGYNTWLTSTREEHPGVMLTRVLFDGTIRVEEPVRIGNAESLTPLTYVPSGSTALYDALRDGLGAMDALIGPHDRALVLVVTDGEENASTRTDADWVHTAIKERTDRGNWTFTYLSADPNGFTHAKRIGIPRLNSSSFAATQEGMRSAWNAVTMSTRSYMSHETAQSASFYGPRGSGEEDVQWRTTTDDTGMGSTPKSGKRGAVLSTARSE